MRYIKTMGCRLCQVVSKTFSAHIPHNKFNEPYLTDVKGNGCM